MRSVSSLKFMISNTPWAVSCVPRATLHESVCSSRVALSTGCAHYDYVGCTWCRVTSCAVLAWHAAAAAPSNPEAISFLMFTACKPSSTCSVAFTMWLMNSRWPSWAFQQIMPRMHTATPLHKTGLSLHVLGVVSRWCWCLVSCPRLKCNLYSTMCGSKLPVRLHACVSKRPLSLQEVAFFTPSFMSIAWVGRG